jgi:hypothetical protein
MARSERLDASERSGFVLKARLAIGWEHDVNGYEHSRTLFAFSIAQLEGTKLQTVRTRF